MKMNTFIFRITVTHTIAYFLAGLFALSFLGYDELFAQGSLSHMRDTGSAWVAAGPALQVLRGIILGFILYPFRSIFIETKFGWGKFWILLFGLSYLLTFAAAVGSFEGIIYTSYPTKIHLLGLPEMILYFSLFTLMMWAWCKKPLKAFSIIALILTLIIVLLSIMGVLAAMGILAAGT